MIKESTVLVLGAGASVPYGFPTGDSLRLRICGILNDHESQDCLRILEMCGYGRTHVGRFSEALATSGLPSVDAFLARRLDFAGVGKAVMAALLLSCEKVEALRAVNGKPGNLDWYGELWARMMDGVHTLEELIACNNVRFLTFNYDRSLEMFLYGAIQTTFGLDEHATQNALGQFNIVHIYGSLGTFDAPGSYGWPRAADAAEAILQGAIEGIRVVPIDREQPEPARKELFRWADQVLILGFSFDPVNCLRLGLADSVREKMGTNSGALKPRLYATTLGLSSARVERARRDLLDVHWQADAGIDMSPWACLYALREWDKLQ